MGMRPAIVLALFVASLFAVPALDAKDRRSDNRYRNGDYNGRYYNNGNGRGYGYGRSSDWQRDRWRAQQQREYLRERALRQRAYERELQRQRYYNNRYNNNRYYNNNGYYNNRYYNNPGAGYVYVPNSYYGSPYGAYDGSSLNSIGGILGMFLR